MIRLKNITQNIRKHDKFSGILSALTAAALAFAGGMTNGLLGTGAGIFLLAALKRRRTDDFDAGPGDPVRDRFASTIAVVLPLSAISLGAYRDVADFSACAPYLFPGILGGIVGALLLDVIPAKLIRRLFSLMLLVAGVQMLLR